MHQSSFQSLSYPIACKSKPTSNPRFFACSTHHPFSYSNSHVQVLILLLHSYLPFQITDLLSKQRILITPLHLTAMIPNIEKPKILEIKIRMDCNGCVQKIKKALHGINGIYEIYIDFPQQKLTVVGWADQEKVMKAIKKTRKIATICTHPESNENPPPPAENPTPENPPPQVAENPPPPTENPPPPPENPPPSEATNPPAADSAPPPPPPPPTPTPPPPPENTIPEVTPSAVATDTAASLPSGPTETKDVEVIHVIDRQTHDYKYTMHHNGGHGFRHGAGAPHYVSYNYRPAVYVPEYGYAPSPSRNSRFTRVEHNVDDHPHRMEGNGNNITSMFSDENPNACSVM